MKLINTESTGYMATSAILSYSATCLSEAIISGIMDTLFVPKPNKFVKAIVRIGKSGIILATYPRIWSAWWNYIDSAADTVNTVADLVSKNIHIRVTKVDGETAEAIRTILADKDLAKDISYKQENQKADMNYFVNEMLGEDLPPVNESVDVDAAEEE